MIKTLRVKLHPTRQQEQLMWQSAGTARWAYNWALARQDESYSNGDGFVRDWDLRKELTQLKKSTDFNWLNDVSAQIPKQAIKDACDAYLKFFRKQSSHPRFKHKKRDTPSFYQRNDKLKYSNGRVSLEKVGWVKTAEKLPEGPFTNPRVKFDGLAWYLTVGIESGDLSLTCPKTEPIGIDLGIKELAVVSTGEVVPSINKTHEVRRLSRKLKRLQRQASRHYSKYRGKGCERRYEKTSNLLKLERDILLVIKKLRNIRSNHLHQVTSSLVKANPEFIVIEDLNVSSLLKNRHLARLVQEQGLREFRRQLEYKCQWYGVKLVIANRYFPSSKLCSQCGQLKPDLKLSDRTYQCDCGLHIDRDLNAAINLLHYGELAI